MERDAAKVANQVYDLYPACTDNQLCALSDFAYNLGVGSLRASTLLAKLKRGNINGAADEFLRWNKCRGKVLKGLTIRRIAERELLICG
jgi:lysozyme